MTSVPAGTGALRVRLLGYAPATQSVTVQAGQTITADVALTPMAESLAEIVVTGYGAQVAGNITGAVSTVSYEDFNAGRIVSPAQLISGKAPGVQVIDNNEPGGGLAIRIRGSTSAPRYGASSEPLYVIDGMVVGGGAGTGLSAGRDGLNFLNPNDIENVTVLRDASRGNHSKLTYRSKGLTEDHTMRFSSGPQWRFPQDAGVTVLSRVKQGIVRLNMESIWPSRFTRNFHVIPVCTSVF